MASGSRLAERLPPTTQRVRDLYRWVAPFYDGFRSLWSRLTLPVERELDRLFRGRIGEQTRILELGPGTGINVARLRREAPRFASYLGVDASEAMLARARPLAAGDPRIVLRVGDATDLASLDGPFDLIISTWMLSHLDAPVALVESCLAQLAPAGSAVFVFFSRPGFAPLRWLVGALGHLFRYRLVDPERVKRVPGLEASLGAAAGMATLAVFRAPSASGPGA